MTESGNNIRAVIYFLTRTHTRTHTHIHAHIHSHTPPAHTHTVECCQGGNKDPTQAGENV